MCTATTGTPPFRCCARSGAAAPGLFRQDPRAFRLGNFVGHQLVGVHGLVEHQPGDADGHPSRRRRRHTRLTRRGRSAGPAYFPRVRTGIARPRIPAAGTGPKYLESYEPAKSECRKTSAAVTTLPDHDVSG